MITRHEGAQVDVISAATDEMANQMGAEWISGRQTEKP